MSVAPVRPALPLAPGVAALALLLATSARAADPLLAIETGTHSGAITSLAVDRAGRLATASVDGTVRLWSLRTHALLGTLRPPSYPGEGDLYAVAFSPDGQTLATGGLTQFYDLSSGQGSSIYLFHSGTGQLTRRIPGPPSRMGAAQSEPIIDLAYAPDGGRLAVARGWGHADVFLSGSGLPQNAPLAHDGRVTSLDIDRAGRMVLASPDGYLRLYDAALDVLAEERLPEGAVPQRVRFSPGGDKLAVSLEDRIEVRGSRDLKPLYQADVRGLGGDGRALAWVPEGRQLCLGGTAGVRCFADEGRGARRDLGGHDVSSLVALPGGALAYGALDASWGLLGLGGQQGAFSTGRLALRPGELWCDSTGHTVQFPLGDGTWRRFSVDDRVLRRVPAQQGADAGLRPATTTAPRGQLSDWQGKRTVRLGKRTLLPENDDRVVASLAVAPDGVAIYLGTGDDLRAYHELGPLRFRVAVPGGVRAVNASADGRVVVVAGGDGTLRWYHARDGKELLALFLSADGARWVAFTPQGFYDASVGGESLVGWQLNPEPGDVRAAQFFPAALFRKTFYHPEVVAASLAQAQAPPSAQASSPAPPPVRTLLPPVVTILDPADGAVVDSDTATLRVALRSPSGEPITALRVLRDGREVARTRGVVRSGDESQAQATPATAARAPAAGGGERVLLVPLPAAGGSYTVAVLAETARGPGEATLVHLKRRAAARSSPVAAEVRPRLLLLAVGVSLYQRDELRLGYAAKDARDLAGALQAQQGRAYRSVSAQVLTDKAATRDNIRDKLEWLQHESTAQDVVVVFLAGHGINDPATGQYYYLPYDADPARMMRTMVTGLELQSILGSLPGRVLVFLDTCHAGNVLTRGATSDVTRFVNELSSPDHGVVVLTSSTGRQASQEASAWKNGAFTLALLEGLDGKADFQHTGRVTLNMLDLYLSERVRALTGGTQTPATAKPITVPDFTVALSAPRP